MPRPTELAGKAIGKMKGLRHGLAGHRGIMKQLAEEHGEISVLMSRCDKADDGATRQELFTQIRRLLLAHAKAEAEVFYGRLEEFAETRELAERRADEHHEMEDIIDRLYTMGYEGEDWGELFDELVSSVRDHVREEENGLFEAATEVLSESELGNLENRYIAAKNMELQRLH